MLSIMDTQYIHDTIDGMEYPGCAKSHVLTIKGVDAMYNGKLMSSRDAVMIICGELVHKVLECDGFENGTWLKNPEYKPLGQILNQTEEDYMLNIEVANFMYACKVAVNECIKHPESIMLLTFDGEEQRTCLYIDEDIDELLDDMKKGDLEL